MRPGDSPPRTILVSLVGLQPSAPAVIIKTWIANRPGGPDRILLLGTTKAFEEGHMDRLVCFLAGFVPRARCQPERISDRTGTVHGAEPARVVIERVLRELGDGWQVVFCGDCGRKEDLIELALAMPPATTFLFSDHKYLRAFDGPGGRETGHHHIGSLGFDALLKLYDVTAERSASTDWPAGLSRPDDPKGIARQDITLRAASGAPSPRLHFAYERRGHLMALHVIEPEERAQVAGAARTGGRGRVNRRQEMVRNMVRRVQGLDLHLNRLRPIVTVASNNRDARARALAAGINAVPLSTAALQRWTSGDVPQPGHVPFAETAATTAVPIGPAKRIAEHEGQGGDGPPLVLWLGVDPSATLVSLFSHRPKVAVVLYDAETIQVARRADWLAANARRLPVDRVVFVATGFWPTGIEPRIREILGDRCPFRFDITPGTKAQVCAAAGIEGAQMWSLGGGDNMAAPLNGNDRVPLQAPPLVLHGQVCGGPMVEEGCDAKKFLTAADRRVLRLLARLLAQYLADRGVRADLAELRDIDCPAGSLRITHRPAGVSIGTDKATLDRKLIDHGLWLEWVVAAALLDAGADELRVGMKWEWPQRRNVVKDECDVAARFGTSVIVVESKSGRARQTSPKGFVQAEALARQGFGTYAVPMVIRLRADGEEIDRRLNARRGAALLDLALMADATRFGETLSRLRAFRARGLWS